MPNHIVTTFAEWFALPEMFVPTDGQTGGKGATYRVLKVGFFPADPRDCEEKNLPVEPNALRKCFLPTIFVQEKDGAQKLYKLPLSLQEWAETLVASVRNGFPNPFPCNVDFGLKDDRIYAELL